MWRESVLCKREVKSLSLKEEDDSNSRALEAEGESQVRGTQEAKG